MDKIRISFNVSELKELVHCISEVHTSKKLHTKLKLALVKLDINSSSGAISAPVESTDTGHLSMNEIRKRDYELWLTDTDVTETVIKNAKQYMYDNGLMTEEEAEVYEATMFGE
jgi:hypothetical protein